MKKVYVWHHKVRANEVQIAAQDILDAASRMAELAKTDLVFGVLHTLQCAQDVEARADQFPAYLLPNGEVVYQMEDVERYFFENSIGDYDLVEIR